MPSKNKNKSRKKVTPTNNNATAKKPPKPAKDKGFEPAGGIDAMTSADFQMDRWAHLDTQTYLLKDRYVYNMFQAAILQNRHLFQGRIVLEVNCGMGLLSLFAAKAGAKQVYAVDSSHVIDYLRRVVVANKYTNVVHVIKGKLREIELPVDTVDVILCNWLGYSLFFESACDKVIYARDKWLNKATGVIMPDMAKLCMAAVEDVQSKDTLIDWWRHVYGFKMPCMRSFALTEPYFLAVEPHQVLSSEYCIKTLDMYTATEDDLKVRSKFMFEIQRSGRMDGLFTYFTVRFSRAHIPVSFTTSPEAPQTRWLQTVFFFDSPVHVQPKQVLYGGFAMASKRKPCDLEQMQAAFEMFSGDPANMRLETEMRWMLKPRSVQMAEMANPERVAKEFHV